MIRMITIFIDEMIMMMCNAILTPFPLSISTATDVDDHLPVIGALCSRTGIISI